MKREKVSRCISHETVEQVRAAMLKILPKKLPYRVGIHKEVFERLKDNFEIEESDLESAIRIVLFQRCTKYLYLKAMANGRWRYGLTTRRTKIDDDHRKHAKKICMEIEKRRRKVENARRKIRRPAGKIHKKKARKNIDRRCA